MKTQKVACFQGLLLCFAVFAEDETFENICAANDVVDAPESGRYVYCDDENNLNHEFFLHIPETYDTEIPAKLLMLFHGWGGSGDGWTDVVASANDNAFVVVAPTGLSDADYEDNADSGEGSSSKASWNVQGSGTGLDPYGNSICDLELQPESHCYHNSCECTNMCQWTHCGDDITFVLELIEYLKEKFVCFNEVYALGESNGGMLVWDLGMNEESASVFTALATVVGSPHAGYAASKGTNNRLPMITFSGEKDSTIPPGSSDQVKADDRTTSYGGSEVYYYVPVAAMVYVWAKDNGCDTVPVTGSSAWPWDYACSSYCTTDTSWPLVMDCRARWGSHSANYGAITPMVLDFFNAHARNRPCSAMTSGSSCHAEYPRCRWLQETCLTSDAGLFFTRKQRSPTVQLVVLAVLAAIVLGILLIARKVRADKNHRVRVDGNELLEQYKG